MYICDLKSTEMVHKDRILIDSERVLIRIDAIGRLSALYLSFGKHIANRNQEARRAKNLSVNFLAAKETSCVKENIAQYLSTQITRQRCYILQLTPH